MKNNKCKVVFFGTPDFAVPALKALIEAEFCDVALVVTQPDKPKGRHHSKAVPTPVNKIAQEAGIPVIPSKAKGSNAIANEILRLASTLTQNDDVALGILVAYGQIIPQALIESFSLGILNIHPSLLPKYRGSSPIQTTLLNQDAETGVTLMLLDNKMDHGPIVAQETVSLRGTDSMTAGELHNKLAQLGAELLIKTLPDYIAGKITPRAQDESKATYTKKLSKADGIIDWKKSPKEINALACAMNPWPCAWTEVEGKRVLVWSTEILPSGTLLIKEVQPAGKKRMPYEEYLKGHAPLYEGTAPIT